MTPLLALNQRELIFSTLPRRGLMLEWGSGGSTKWFLERMSDGQRLITVEHDDSWLGMCQNFCGKPDHWQPLLRPSSLPVGQNATPWEECSAGLDRYIVPVPTETLASADVFLVDGVARGACLATVAMNAKPGASVFCHDLTRNWYDWILGAPRFIDRHIVEPDKSEYPQLLWCAKLK